METDFNTCGTERDSSYACGSTAGCQPSGKALPFAQGPVGALAGLPPSPYLCAVEVVREYEGHTASSGAPLTAQGSYGSSGRAAVASNAGSQAWSSGDPPAAGAPWSPLASRHSSASMEAASPTSARPPRPLPRASPATPCEQPFFSRAQAPNASATSTQAATYTHAMGEDALAEEMLDSLSSEPLIMRLDSANVGPRSDHAPFFSRGSGGAALSDALGLPAGPSSHNAYSVPSHTPPVAIGAPLRAAGAGPHAHARVGSCQTRQGPSGENLDDSLESVATLLGAPAPGTSLRVRTPSTWAAALSEDRPSPAQGAQDGGWLADPWNAAAPRSSPSPWALAPAAGAGEAWALAPPRHPHPSAEGACPPPPPFASAAMPGAAHLSLVGLASGEAQPWTCAAQGEAAPSPRWRGAAPSPQDVGTPAQGSLWQPAPPLEAAWATAVAEERALARFMSQALLAPLLAPRSEHHAPQAGGLSVAPATDRTSDGATPRGRFAAGDYAASGTPPSHSITPHACTSLASHAWSLDAQHGSRTWMAGAEGFSESLFVQASAASDSLFVQASGPSFARSSPRSERGSPRAGAPARALSARTSLRAARSAPASGAEERAKKKKHNPWTSAETRALVNGVLMLGAGRWAEVKRLGTPSVAAALAHRSPVDLKDKWRNLVRVARLPSQALKTRLAKSGDVSLELIMEVRALMGSNHE